jgi:branched-subunit amino acid transport protein
MLRIIKQEQSGLFTSFTLKCIAITAMLIDHAAYILLPPGMPMLALRLIGRISFPLFCFLIVEGYFHTHNLRRYFMRLFLFALISEIPFDLALNHSLFDVKKQNVFFTLLLGLAMITLIDRACRAFIKKAEAVSPVNKTRIRFAAYAACIAIVSAALTAAVLFKVDYQMVGVLTILVFYLFRSHSLLAVLSMAAVNIVLGGFVQAFAAFSGVPILLYNGKKGRSLRWLFYFFYPVHLMVLYLMKLIISQ